MAMLVRPTELFGGRELVAERAESLDTQSFATEIVGGLVQVASGRRRHVGDGDRWAVLDRSGEVIEDLEQDLARGRNVKLDGAADWNGWICAEQGSDASTSSQSSQQKQSERSAKRGVL